MGKKGIVWMVCLFLSIAVVSAGGTINDVIIEGQNHVPGFLKGYDTLYAEALVEISGDPEITPEQVKFGNSEASACTQVANGFLCNLSVGAESYSPTVASVVVGLYNDQAQLVNSTEYNLLVDGNPPSMELLFDKEYVTGNEPLVVNYSVVDTAFGGSEKCSGIGGVSFYVSPGSSQDFQIGTDSCVAEGSAQIDLNSGENSVEVCGAAYDRLNQTGAWDCFTVEVDSSAPVIADSMRLEINGNPGVLAPGVGYTANAFIRIDDKAINAEEVHADFSGLNPQLSWLSPNECYMVDTGVYECEFEGVQVVPSGSGEITLQVNATDVAGNPVTKVIHASLPLDSTGPEPVSMIINGEDNDPQVVGTTIEQIEVDFNEDGAGMTPDNSFLDLSYFGLGAKVPASECKNTSGTVWSCKWLNIELPQDATDGVISVSWNTTDAVGNPVTSGLTKSVIVDAIPVQVVSFNISQPESPFQLPNNTFVEGIPIVMDARVVEDRDSVSCRINPAWIKASELVNVSNSTLEQIKEQQLNPNETNTGLNSLVTENCEPLGDKQWHCTYKLENPQPGVYNASYIFEDAAKNKAMENVGFIVADLRQTNTSYWQVAGIEMMPSAVDRATAPYLHHQVLYSIALAPQSMQTTAQPVSDFDKLRAQGIEIQPPAESVQLLKVMLENCTGDYNYFYKLDLLDGSDLGNFPMIEGILKQMEMPLHDLNLSCEFHLFSLVRSSDGVWVNENPEIEVIKLQVPFYDTELPDVVLKKKVDKALDNWAVKLTENDIFKTLEMVSEWGKFGAKLDNNLLQVGLGLQSVIAICPQCTFLQPVVDGILKFHEFNSKWMWLVTCNESVVSNLLGKDNPIAKGLESVGNLPKTMPAWMTGWKLMKNVGYSEQELLDPKRSLTASIAKGCIPGIIDNMRQYANIQCGYAYCLQEASRVGAPPTYCDEIKGYTTCMWYGEEAAYFLPVSKLYDDVASAVNSFMSSPVNMVVEGTVGLCKVNDLFQVVGPVKSVCDFMLIGQGLEGIRQAMGAIQNWEDETTPTDYCVKNAQ